MKKMRVIDLYLVLFGVLFVGLKLGGVIAWSWWLVLLPVYAPVGVLLVLLVVLGTLALWDFFEKKKLRDHICSYGRSGGDSQ